MRFKKSDPNSNEYERRFFAILFCIHFVDVFQCLHKSETYKNIVSMVIDTLELILYLSILHKTTALYLIAFLTYGFEMALSGIIIVMELVRKDCNSECASPSCGAIFKRIWPFVRATLLYLILEVPQIPFLFLQQGSKFLGTYYEVVVIISVYFGGVACDYLEDFFVVLGFDKIGKLFGTTDEEKHTLLDKVCFTFTVIVCLLVAVFILPISTIVLASIELRDNAENLPKYDHGIYIYFLVFNSVWYLILIIISMWLGYRKCRKSK